MFQVFAEKLSKFGFLGRNWSKFWLFKEKVLGFWFFRWKCFRFLLKKMSKFVFFLGQNLSKFWLFKEKFWFLGFSGKNVSGFCWKIVKIWFFWSKLMAFQVKMFQVFAEKNGQNIVFLGRNWSKFWLFKEKFWFFGFSGENVSSFFLKKMVKILFF